MTKSQKRNARRRRAQCRAMGTFYSNVLVAYASFSRTKQREKKQQLWDELQKINPKEGLLARSQFEKRVRTQFSDWKSYAVRQWNRSWVTTSRDMALERLAELKEVIVDAITTDLTAYPDVSFRLTCWPEGLAGPEIRIKGDHKWLATGKVEAVAADVIAVLSL